jgi:hypothetical protein
MSSLRRRSDLEERGVIMTNRTDRERVRQIFAWLNQVVADGGISPSAFKLAFLISQRVNGEHFRETGELLAWPAVETLAAGLGLSGRQVITLLRHHLGDRHLQIETGGKGQKDTNRYRLWVKSTSPITNAKDETDFTLKDTTRVKSSAAKGEGQRFSRVKPTSAESIERDNQLKEPSDERVSPDGFDLFWQAYPKKVGKGHARTAFNKAVKAGTKPETIINGATRYAAERASEDPRYTKHPQTWLRAECWLDEPQQPRYRSMSAVDAALSMIGTADE